MKYKITATYIENDCRLVCDIYYALGEYAGQTWDSFEEAEEIAEKLLADVGSVVDASVEYAVEIDYLSDD